MFHEDSLHQPWSEWANKRIRFLRHVGDVLAVGVAVSLPGVIALDCGGHWAWDYWVLSVAGCVVVLLVSLGVTRSQLRRPGEGPIVTAGYWEIWGYQASRCGEWFVRWGPLVVVGGFSVLSLVQLIPWSANWVRRLSPASADAYQRLQLVGISADSLDSFAVSVNPFLTQNFLARSIIVAAMAYVGGRLFSNRSNVVVLLWAFALMAVLHSVAGFYQQATSPKVYLGGVESIGRPFGTFVNRNNAGALLNLGIACGVGLGVHYFHHYVRPHQVVSLAGLGRVHSASSQVARGQRWTSWTVMALVIAMLCVSLAGILVCGSRGAFLGTLAGSLACVMTAVSTRKTIPVALFMIFGAASVLMILNRSGLEATSIERILQSDVLEASGESRIDHWDDGVNAAFASTPLGGGMGAYRYLLMPFQRHGSSWYWNADNQWLEWFVEGGIPAIVLLCVGFTTSLVSLKRLAASVHDIDKGLAMAGTFALAAILFSQTFDFALTVSSVGISAALLAAAVHARQSASDQQTEDEYGDPFGFQSPTNHLRVRIQRFISSLIVPVLMLFCLGWACERTMQSAKIQWLVLTGEQLALIDPSDAEHSIIKLERLYELETQVQQVLSNDSGCEDLARIASRIQRQLFRIESASLLIQKFGQSPTEAAALTKTNQLRYHSGSRFEDGRELGKLDLQNNVWLKRLCDISHEVLRQNPMSEVARWNLIHLDFSEGSVNRARVLLDQLMQLRRRNATTLMNCAYDAEAIGSPSLTAKALRFAIEADQKQLTKIGNGIFEGDFSVSLYEVLPFSEGADLRRRSIVLAAALLQADWTDSKQDAEVRDEARQILKHPISKFERESKLTLFGPSIQ